jgi:diguanylate cyclase (GGDEF)-like protein
MYKSKQDKQDAAAPPVEARRILIVDDEAIIRTLLSEVMIEEGYEAITSGSGEEAIDLIERAHYDLIISDIVMPRVNGIEVLIAAKRIDPDCPVIMITGYPSANTVVRLVNLGAADYITKPFNVDYIRLTVAKVLEMKKVWQASNRVGMPTDLPTIDAVTGAYNFAMFNQLLDNELERSKWRGHVCSLLVAEIDNFPEYTSRGPAGAGDKVARVFVDGLKREARPGDFVGRMAVSEFAMALPETGRGDAHTLGEAIRANVGWNISINAGVACYPLDASDSEGLSKLARTAARAAKLRGGDAILLPA